MRSSFRTGCQRAIIGIALAVSLALSGCSALKLGYNNGPSLAWWWVDGYFDFSSRQSPLVKDAIGRWFEWHRATQLEATAALLVQAQAQAVEPLTPALACRWEERVRELLAPSIDQALVLSASIVPTLGDAQFRHLEQTYAKKIQEMRDDFLQDDLQERERKSVERAIERTETLYGRLGDVQRRVIEAGVKASPFDPALWMTERQRRQRDTLQTLRRLVAEKADADTRLAALRALVDRSERSPNPEYRAYVQKLREYNCALAARIHNATTPAQRQVAREKLRGWEEDARVLASERPNAATLSPSPQ